MEYVCHLHWYRGDMINWMWKLWKSILGCPSSFWNFFYIWEIFHVEMWKVPCGHPHRQRGDMIICMWKWGKSIQVCLAPYWIFSTNKRIPCKNVEHKGHLQWYRGEMINWMWKGGKSILICPASFRIFLHMGNIPCGNVESTLRSPSQV